ncbi:MAG TPA: hypothetical protein VMW68_05970 [Methyloceanibacter sp.]|nr:hypothetical protein [Methyloceanibacter sp.]
MTEPNWIAAFLEGAATANLCTRIHCTTCGAIDFRRGLIRKANDAQGTDVPAWNDSLAEGTAEGLAHLPADLIQTHVEALRLVFFELWSNLGDAAFKRIVEARVRETPAGSVLQTMQEHYAQVELSRRAEAERCDPAISQKRRESRKAEKAAAHAARLAAKLERDRMFRANDSQPYGQRKS